MGKEEKEKVGGKKERKKSKDRIHLQICIVNYVVGFVLETRNIELKFSSCAFKG